MEPSKSVKCIETGEVFENVSKAKEWLANKNIIISKNNAAIKNVCKGKQEKAHGYHWEFVGER